MRHALLLWLTQYLRVRFIRIENRDYLERYYLGKIFGITFYLHRFVADDAERWLHDHPWRAVALVLRGSYREQCLRHMCSRRGIVTDVKTRKAGRINLIGVNKFHRIMSATPDTWTLFIHGRRIKEWGFIEDVPTPAHESAQINYRQPLDLSQTTCWQKTAPLAWETRL